MNEFFIYKLKTGEITQKLICTDIEDLHANIPLDSGIIPASYDGVPTEIMKVDVATGKLVEI